MLCALLLTLRLPSGGARPAPKLEAAQAPDAIP